MPDPVFLDYSQAELDAQYDQATLVPDLSPYVSYWSEESARVRETQACRLDIAYGPSPEETLDVFPAAGGNGPSPVMVHVHGGAWRRLTKDHVSFPAGRFAGAGAAWVAVNFALTPAVTLSELVRQNRAALAWVWRNAASFGGDPDRIHVCGHSSGGHVAGTLVQDGWRADFGVPEDLIKGAVLCSGLYDLTPVRLSARNEYLNLGEDDVRALSPIQNIPDRLPPLSLFWGEGELDEFRRQSRAFAEALWARGADVDAAELAGLNHFDLSRGFADPNSPILHACLGQMGLL